MSERFLYTTWGYDMTIVDYAMVLSETDKTILCQRIGSRKSDDYGQSGYVIPNPGQKIGKPFRLHKRNGYSVGSYPFADDNEHKKSGMFWDWDGEPLYFSEMD